MNNKLVEHKKYFDLMDWKTKKQNLSLIEEAIRDCRDMKITYTTFIFIVSSIINPEEPTQEAIEWAINTILKRKTENV